MILLKCFQCLQRSPGLSSRFNDPNNPAKYDGRRFDRPPGRGPDARNDVHPSRHPLPHYKDRWHSRSRSPRPQRDGSRGDRDERRHHFSSRDDRSSSLPRSRKHADDEHSDKEPGELGSHRQEKRQGGFFLDHNRHASPFHKKRNRSPSSHFVETQRGHMQDDGLSQKVPDPQPAADELVARINKVDEDLTAMRTELAEIELEQIRLEAEEPRTLKALEKAQEVPRPVAPEPLQDLDLDESDEYLDEEDEDMNIQEELARSKSKRQYRSSKKTVSNQPNQTIPSSRETLLSRLGSLLSASVQDDQCKSILSESNDLSKASHSRFAHLDPISLASHTVPSRVNAPQPSPPPPFPGVSVLLQREFKAILRAHVASAIQYRSRLETWKKKEFQRRVAIASATPQLSTGSGGGWAAAAGAGGGGGGGGGDIDGGGHSRRAMSGRGVSTSSMDLPTSPSLGRSASRGLRADIVRSDLEERQAIAVLNAVDALKHMVDLPTMALTSPRAARWTLHYIDRNRLVCDPVKELQIHSWTRPWNEDEKEVFAEKFLAYHKDFVRIASFLPERTIPEVIRHYYAVQRSDDFELTRRKYQLKKRRDKAEENAQVVASTTKSQCIAGYIVPTARLKAPQIPSTSPFRPKQAVEDTSLDAVEVQSVVLGTFNLKRSNSRNSGMFGVEDSTDDRRHGERSSSGTSRGGSGGLPLLDSTSRLFSPQQENRSGRKRGRGRGRGRGDRRFSAQRDRGQGLIGADEIGAEDVSVVVWKAVPVYPEIEFPLPKHRKPRAPRVARATFITLHHSRSSPPTLSLEKSSEGGGASGSALGSEAEVTATGTVPRSHHTLPESNKDVEEDEGMEDEEGEDSGVEEATELKEITGKSSGKRRPSAARDAKFVEGIQLYGTKWSFVAAHMGNRTGGSARLYWARHARRLGLLDDDQTPRLKEDGQVVGDDEEEDVTKAGVVNESALKGEGLGGSSRRGKPSYWSAEEKAAIVEAYSLHGRNWERLQAAVPTKTLTQIRNYYQNYRSKIFEPIVLPPGAVGPRRKNASIGCAGKALDDEMTDKGKGLKDGASQVPHATANITNDPGAFQHQIKQYQQQQQALLMHLMAQSPHPPTQQQQQQLAPPGGVNGQPNNEHLAKFVAMMKSNPAAALQFQAQALLMVQMAQHVAQHAAQRDQSSAPVSLPPMSLPPVSLPPMSLPPNPPLTNPKEVTLESSLPTKPSLSAMDGEIDAGGVENNAIPRPATQEPEDGGPAQEQEQEQAD